LFVFKILLDSTVTTYKQTLKSLRKLLEVNDRESRELILILLKKHFDSFKKQFNSFNLTKQGI